MRPFDIERGFLRPTTTRPRLPTAGKYLPEASVCLRAGGQLKFRGEHAQVFFRCGVMKSIDDGDGACAACRRQFVNSSNQTRCCGWEKQKLNLSCWRRPSRIPP